MIKIKLCELLGKNKMTRKDLALAIDARPNTIGDLYNEKTKKIDIVLLSNICKELNCEVGEILEYVRDGDKNEEI